MPKFFYILYFTSVHTSFVEYLLKAAHKIFKNFTIEHSTQGGKFVCLVIKGDEPIYPWEITKLESLFGDYVGEIIFSHNNATAHGAEVASMEEVGPQHVYSVGGLVKFSFWEILILKRFFFVHNTKKLVLNSSDMAGFCYHNEFLCFFLQSDNPVLQTEIEFLNHTISPRYSNFFETTI